MAAPLSVLALAAAYCACTAGSAAAGTVSSEMAVMVARARTGMLSAQGKARRMPVTPSTQALSVAASAAKAYDATLGLATTNWPLPLVASAADAPVSRPCTEPCGA